jgi:hypothetical protein
MQRLFWKIFGWFWGAMVLIGLTLFFVVTTAQPDPLPLEWRDATSATMNAYAVTASNAWENGGEKKLADYLDQQSVEIGGRFWLYLDNRELTGRPPGGGRQRGGPPPFRQLQEPSRRQQQFPPPFPPPGAPPGPPEEMRRDDGPPRGRPHPEMFRDLRESASRSGKTQFLRFGNRVLVVHRIRAASAKTYLLQADIPAPRLGRPAAGLARQVIGVLAMLLISGVVCYGLVHYCATGKTQRRDRKFRTWRFIGAHWR